MKIDIRIEGDPDQTDYLKWWFSEGGGLKELEEALQRAMSGAPAQDYPIEELELGVRSYNCLKRVGIDMISDLVSKAEYELESIPNLGKKSVEEVKEALAVYNLSLRLEEGQKIPLIEKGVIRDFAVTAITQFRLIARRMDPRALKYYVESPNSFRSVLESALVDAWDQLVDAWDQEQQNQRTREALDSLPERDRLVLELRFGLGGEPQALRAIASEISVSPERVRQLVHEALRKLTLFRWSRDEVEKRLHQLHETRKAEASKAE